MRTGILAAGKKFLKIGTAIIGSGALIAAFGVAFIPAGAALERSAGLEVHKDRTATALPALSTPSRVYAADGSQLALFQAEINREPVPLDRVPAVLTRAVLAAEDADFYKHRGIDLASMGRALVVNIRAGGISQGGSTITQQLIKNTFLLDKEKSVADRTLSRKIKEAVLAVRLEKQFSKRQILERYLNTVYLGNGAYGVQAATKLLFDKDVGQIDVGEAALVAALIASPSRFDPFKHPDNALSRRKWVLSRLTRLHWISPPDLAAAKQAPLPTEIHTQFHASTSDYFIEAVKQELLDPSNHILPGDKQQKYDAVFYGGLKIYTTLDPHLQQVATDQVESQVGPRSSYTAALVSVDVASGGVVALYGGADFATAKFDLASQGRRQPGSTFKVFGLVGALEHGYSPMDMFDGSSGCRYKDDPSAGPVASHGGGPMTLWEGTKKSVNCVYVNLVNALGPDKVVETAQKMGVRSKLNDYGSIILGSQEVTPLEMAGSFSTLASGGLERRTHLVSHVVDSAEKDVYQFGAASDQQEQQVVDPNVAATSVAVMKTVLESGGTAAGQGIGRPAAGKTGTTQDNADAWFVGFTPQISTAVWMGNPHKRVSLPFYGGGKPAELWSSYMTQASESLPVLDFAASNLSLLRGGDLIGASTTPSASVPQGPVKGYVNSPTGSTNTARQKNETSGSVAKTTDESPPTTKVKETPPTSKPPGSDEGSGSGSGDDGGGGTGGGGTSGGGTTPGVRFR